METQLFDPRFNYMEKIPDHIYSEIPQEIQHFYHPDHLLKLCEQREEDVQVRLRCVACDSGCYNNFFYRCAECPDFIMDIQCALWRNKLQETKSIQYRHHPHPLTLRERALKKKKGKKTLHVRAFRKEKGKQTQHERTDGGGGGGGGTNHNEDYCVVCGSPCLGSMYKCDHCPSRTCNYHEACAEIDLPQEIHHYFHPHPLSLITNGIKGWPSDIKCLACHLSVTSVIFFQCLECASYMHIHCALLPDKLKQDDHIRDLSHGHPLSLCDSEENICSACKEPCADPTYGCKRCSFFIHGSCTGLPRQINHPLHPPHLLTLTFIPKKDPFDPDFFFCKGCRQFVDTFLAYKCGECSFLLDAICGGLNPTITVEEHDHIITLTTRKISSHPDCIVCSAPIPDGSLYFSCADYDCSSYKLHLLCGPLPCTVKDKCHVDPLKLMDAFVGDYDETDMVYCDTCEQLRDPNEPVYYCKDCNFISEIKCVMSEVLRSLEGRHGNVKLRTANKTRIWHIGKVFSARCADILEEDEIDTEIKYIREKYFEVKLDVPYKGLDFFTIGESVQILKIFQEAGLFYSPLETISERSISETMGNDDFSWSKLLYSIKKQGLRLQSQGDIVSLVPSYSNEALRNLMKNLDSFYGDPSFLRMLDYDGGIVRIGDLMIMQDLASYLKGLLHTHGDFTSNSTLEPRLKMFFLNLLCDIVRSMCINNVREVDEKTLWRWWKSLQTVKRIGFEVQFLIDRLSRIALALFGIRVKASFAEIKSPIDETYDEMKEMEAKLEAKKRELEAFKLEQALIKKSMKCERTPEMKECLQHESELKWKKAWEGSPVMFQRFLDGSQRS